MPSIGCQDQRGGSYQLAWALIMHINGYMYTPVTQVFLLFLIMKSDNFLQE